MSTSHTRLQAGDASATWFYQTLGTPDESSLTVVEWAALPAGRLKNLLNAKYASLVSFMSAWAAQGGTAYVLMNDSGTGQVWSLDGAGYPVLWHYEGGFPTTRMSIRIALGHSLTD